MDEMLTAGEILKRKREQKDYSLAEVSAATKIQKHYLEAIEENNFDRFPSDVYTKGFLQNYAKFLQIDANKILALYRRSQGEKKPKSIGETPQIKKQPKLILTPTLILIITVGIIVIGTFAYLILQFYKFQRPPELQVSQPSGNITVDQKEYTIKGKTEPDMFVTINDEAVKVDATGKFEVDIKLSEGTNTLIIKSRHPDNIGREAVVTRNIEYETEDGDENQGLDGDSDAADNDSQENDTNDSDSGSNTDDQDGNENADNQEDSEGSSNDKINLIVKITTAPAWIEIEIDGELVYAATAQPGEELQFAAENRLSVLTGRLSSTTVEINGKETDLYVAQAGVGTILCEINDSRETVCREP